MPIRVGIIGAGGIALNFHLPELAAIKGVTIAALANRRLERARRLAAKFDVPRITSDYRDLLSDPAIDAVVVATYHPTHASIACEALRAGKHVLVQKPLATTREDAAKLLAVSRRSKAVSFALPYLHTPAALATRRLVWDGAVGHVHTVRCRVAHNGPEAYERPNLEFFGESGKKCWFFDKKTAHVGALFDMGVYALTELTSILGTVKRVRAVVGNVAKETSQVEDNAVAILEFACGAVGIAETSWSQEPGSYEVAVYGTAGTIRRPHDGRELAVLSEQKPVSSPRLKKKFPTAHEHFITCCRHNEKPLSTIEQARHVVDIMLAMYEAEKTGSAVRVRSSYDPRHAVPPFTGERSLPWNRR